jgi:hypothetical protein
MFRNLNSFYLQKNLDTVGGKVKNGMQVASEMVRYW